MLVFLKVIGKHIADVGFTDVWVQVGVNGTTTTEAIISAKILATGRAIIQV